MKYSIPYLDKTALLCYITVKTKLTRRRSNHATRTQPVGPRPRIPKGIWDRKQRRPGLQHVPSQLREAERESADSGTHRRSCYLLLLGWRDVRAGIRSQGEHDRDVTHRVRPPTTMACTAWWFWYSPLGPWQNPSFGVYSDVIQWMAIITEGRKDLYDLKYHTGNRGRAGHAQRICLHQANESTYEHSARYSPHPVPKSDRRPADCGSLLWAPSRSYPSLMGARHDRTVLTRSLESYSIRTRSGVILRS